MQVTMDETNNVIYGNNILLQKVNTTHECGINIIYTTEGVYISNDPAANLMPYATSEITLKTHLILADIDYKTYMLH